MEYQEHTLQHRLTIENNARYMKYYEKIMLTSSPSDSLYEYYCVQYKWWRSAWQDSTRRLITAENNKKR